MWYWQLNNTQFRYDTKIWYALIIASCSSSGRILSSKETPTLPLFSRFVPINMKWLTLLLLNKQPTLFQVFPKRHTLSLEQEPTTSLLTTQPSQQGSFSFSTVSTDFLTLTEQFSRMLPPLTVVWCEWTVSENILQQPLQFSPGRPPTQQELSFHSSTDSFSLTTGWAVRILIPIGRRSDSAGKPCVIVTQPQRLNFSVSVFPVQ